MILNGWLNAEMGGNQIEVFVFTAFIKRSKNIISFFIKNQCASKYQKCLSWRTIFMHMAYSPLDS